MGGRQGRIRLAVHHRRRGGGPPDPLPTRPKGPSWEKAKIYHRENVVGPFLVHKLLGLRPPPFFQYFPGSKGDILCRSPTQMHCFETTPTLRDVLHPPPMWCSAAWPLTDGVFTSHCGRGAGTDGRSPPGSSLRPGWGHCPPGEGPSAGGTVWRGGGGHGAAKEGAPLGGVPCAVRKVGCSPPPGVR